MLDLTEKRYYNTFSNLTKCSANKITKKKTNEPYFSNKILKNCFEVHEPSIVL